MAILSNKYKNFESGSIGLYLSQILKTLDEIEYDDSFGGVISAIPPINLL